MFHSFRIDYYQRIVENWVAILRALNIHDRMDIIDLCPGWAPKVEMALAELNYCGVVRLLDKNIDHLARLEEYFRFYFDSSMRFDKISDDLLHPKVSLTGDLVIANHIIDDILIDAFLKNDAADNLYQQGEKFCQIWDKISRDIAFLDRVVVMLSTVFSRLIKPGGMLVVAQYPGHIETEFNLNHSVSACHYVVNGLFASLENQGTLRRNLVDQIYQDLKHFYIPKDGLWIFRAF